MKGEDKMTMILLQIATCFTLWAIAEVLQKLYPPEE